MERPDDFEVVDGLAEERDGGTGGQGQGRDDALGVWRD